MALRLESGQDCLEIVYTGREDQHPGGLLAGSPTGWRSARTTPGAMTSCTPT